VLSEEGIRRRPWALYSGSWALVWRCSFVTFAIVVHPLIIAIRTPTNWPTAIFSFLVVAVGFALLTTAWTLTSKEKQPEASDALKRHRLKVALSDAKDFSIWLLLTWTEYVTFFLIYVFSIIFVLAGPLRQLVYAVSLKSRMWARDYSTFFSGILFMFYVQLAVAIPAIAYTYFGKDRLIDGIAVAAGLLIFVARQLQKMTMMDTQLGILQMLLFIQM